MTSGRRSIVIIDDEEDLCFLLGSMLKAQGFAVQSFYTLSAGLTALRELKPDWIIIDNDLPDGRGWESTDKILSECPDSDLIKISANPDSQKTHHTSNVHYLIKPIHVNSITELIENRNKETGRGL